jgi:hypothetical protein
LKMRKSGFLMRLRGWGGVNLKFRLPCGRWVDVPRDLEGMVLYDLLPFDGCARVVIAVNDNLEGFP